MTARAYRLVSNRLQLAPAEAPEIGPHDVLVRIEAASLNYRDLLVARGQIGVTREGLIPVSDGAGTVTAVGSAVTRWRKGDRVAPIFYKDWITGPYREAYSPSSLGGENTDGVLSEQVVMPEASLVRIPDSWSFAEAATLPCAALTAWQALFVRGGLKPDDTLLVQGTGGVAIFGLQFSTAIGARTIVLSSSDEKRKRAEQLGAWATINSKTTPEWDVEVHKLTNGLGVSHLLELGGPGTFDRSLRATRAGGHIAQIGVFTGFGPQSNLMRLQLINATIDGINVGSREQFEAMNAFLVAHDIKPVIDKRFAFEEAQAAYDELASGRHFGKVAITFA